MKRVVSLALLVVLVDPRAGWAARAPKHVAEKAPVTAKDVRDATGRAVVHGYGHILHSIKPHSKGTLDAKGRPRSLVQRWVPPLKYASMVGGIFVLGAGMRLFHIDPFPFMAAGSGLGFAYQVKARAWPRLRDTRGIDRYEAAIQELVVPATLVVGSTALGVAVGHGGEAALTGTESMHLSHPAVPQAGAQSAIVAFDVPTLVQNAADHGDIPAHGPARVAAHGAGR